MGRGVHEGEQPGPAVGRGDRHDQGDGDQGGHDLHDGAEPDAGDEEERQRDDAEDHRRPHVGLGQDEHAGEARHEEERADDAAVGGVLIEAAGDEVGGEEGERQLHQLGGLQAELPEAHPAARAHRVHAEARHQHHEEEAERHQQEQRAEATQAPVVEAPRDAQRDGPDRHPHALADEDRPGGAVGGDGDHRRRGPDHHETDHTEQRHVGQQEGRDRHVPPAHGQPGRRRPLGPASPFRRHGRRHRRHSPRARPSARSDTRCTPPVSRTGPPKWRRVCGAWRRGGVGR